MLWPPPTNASALALRPSAICDLANGIREGALEGKGVPEIYYRAFIHYYCATYRRRSEDDARNSDIKAAYNFALNAVSVQPLPAEDEPFDDDMEHGSVSSDEDDTMVVG